MAAKAKADPAALSREGHEAGLTDPEAGFYENPYIYPSNADVAAASLWWHGFDRARHEHRRREEKARALRVMAVGRR